MDKFLGQEIPEKVDGSSYRTMPMQWKRLAILIALHRMSWLKRKNLLLKPQFKLMILR